MCDLSVLFANFTMYKVYESAGFHSFPIYTMTFNGCEASSHTGSLLPFDASNTVHIQSVLEIFHGTHIPSLELRNARILWG